MMRVVLHAGTHKTATTTFQGILVACSSLLIENGVFVPKIKDWPQHSYLAWMLQSREECELALLIEECLQQARQARCDTVILSGEDFENCLIDLEMGRRFEAILYRAGVKNIEWIFAVREPVDYLQSIYATMSGHRVLLNLDEISKIVYDRGYFSVSNSSYNYIFVLDVGEFVGEFRKAVKGQVSLIAFERFIDDYAGSPVINTLVGNAEARGRIRAIASAVPLKNTRKAPKMVEYDYAVTSLGLSPKDKELLKDHQELIEAIARARIEHIKRLEPEVNERIRLRFGSRLDSEPITPFE